MVEEKHQHLTMLLAYSYNFEYVFITKVLFVFYKFYATSIRLLGTCYAYSNTLQVRSRSHFILTYILSYFKILKTNELGITFMRESDKILLVDIEKSKKDFCFHLISQDDSDKYSLISSKKLPCSMGYSLGRHNESFSKNYILC